MLTLLGSVFLLVGSVCMGSTTAADLKRRAEVLRAFRTATEVMERELSYAATEMPELLVLLGRQIPPPVNSVFLCCTEELKKPNRDQFHAIWRSALEVLPVHLLNQEARNVWGQLGDVLGRYDVQEQCAALAGARVRLDGLLRQAEDTRDRSGRVYRTVSAAAGLLLVILLL